MPFHPQEFTLVVALTYSDINTVQGKYPLQPKYDDVPGHEGVGEVVGTGTGTSTLKEGDWVVPVTSGLGTWRTHGAASHTSDTATAMTNGAAQSGQGCLCVSPPESSAGGTFMSERDTEPGCRRVF